MNELQPADRSVPARGVARGAWVAAGLALVGVGGIGAVVPVLPSTVFFIGAAGCFARSSPRLERWVLDLPHVGPLVRDYRNGLGMPRRAKATASTAIAVAVTLSAAALATWPSRGAALALGLVGIAYVTLRVPTRERVLAELAALDRHVLALGGGVVLRPENRAIIKQAGGVVWLTADPETIHSRLSSDSTTASRRPDLTAAGGIDEIRALLTQREPLYRECATMVVDTGGRRPAEVADEVLRQISVR